MKKNRFLKISISLGMILLMGVLSFTSACSEKAPATQTPAAQAPAVSAAAVSNQAQTTTPKSGGILKIGNIVGSAILNLGYPPTQAPEIDAYNIESCVETLFTYDRNMNIMPRLATGYKVADDAKSVTINLRKGVKFHDGSDFNATVCKWNIENFMKSARKELTNVTSVDMIDDYSIRINLKVYDSVILNKLCADGGRMISQTAFNTHGIEWCGMHPIGTGPYSFVSWEKDISIKYQRFDGYWGGKPYLDGIWFLFYADLTTGLMAFKNGDFDVFLTTNEKDALDLQKTGKYNISVSKYGVTPIYDTNSVDPKSPFADIRVRRAVSYAIEQEGFAKGLTYGFAKVQNQWSMPGTPGYNPDVVGYPYNPDKAKDLLKEAGYANGFDTKIIYLQGPVGEKRTTAFASYLAAVGIRATLEPQQLSKYDLTAQHGGWESGMCEMLTFTRSDVVDSMAPILSYNSNYFVSMARAPGVEDLFNQAHSSIDPKAKWGAIQKMNKMMIDDYCQFTPTFVEGMLAVKSKYIHDDWIFEAAQGYISPSVWMDK